jgi:hypothetical protein
MDENPGQGLITGVNDNADNLSPVTTTPRINYHRVAKISANFAKI